MTDETTSTPSDVLEKVNTPEQVLEKLEELEAKATPGPWTALPGDLLVDLDDDGEEVGDHQLGGAWFKEWDMEGDEGYNVLRNGDMDLVEALRNEAKEALRTSIEEVKRLREELKEEEASHARTIDRRDALEEALAKAYELITEQPCEWSNAFGPDQMVEAVDAHVFIDRKAWKMQSKELTQLRSDNDTMRMALKSIARHAKAETPPYTAGPSKEEQDAYANGNDRAANSLGQTALAYLKLIGEATNV